MRRSGILLPVSSIPSPYGIGSFGKQAYQFIDFLVQAGQQLWQILPLGPTSYGDSPYQSFSTFAGNPYYIDLDQLIQKGYLMEEECKEADFGENEQDVDYAKLYQSRFKILKKAFLRAKEQGLEKTKAFQVFVKENKDWLEDYVLFMAIKDAEGGKSWLQWEEGIRLRREETIQKYCKTYAEEMAFYRFQQFFFWVQWKKLKKYANKNGIKIIGDIPIYVSLDSADVWAKPDLFLLNDNHIPIGVAGCPPDAFSATGQLWGNPLYAWEYHRQTDYEWWKKRVVHNYNMFDILRIDHFRGFDEYWFVPYGDATAEKGHWEKGPGYSFFKTMQGILKPKKVIAEDLGFLTESVIKLVKKTRFPGMKVLQFAFDSREESDYLPHNYSKNCVVYTGTHDNDTVLGWYYAISEHDRNFAKRYLNIKDIKETKEIPWYFIRSALSSTADTAIIPIQDYLELGKEARINIPSTLGQNWRWRMGKQDLTLELAEKIRDITKLYGRI